MQFVEISCSTGVVIINLARVLYVDYSYNSSYAPIVVYFDVGEPLFIRVHGYSQLVAYQDFIRAMKNWKEKNSE